MIQPIPAIDILGGKCVRLEKGDYQQKSIFSNSPVDVATRWVTQGASMLHLVDLDGAKSGQPENYQVIKDVVQSVSVPVEVGGGIRTLRDVFHYLDLGVERVILGSVAFKKPHVFKQILRAAPENIAVSIDQRKGKVAIEGWTQTTAYSAPDAAKGFSRLGVKHFIYTDTERDGTLRGFDISTLREFLDKSGVKVIVAGGITTIEDIKNLNPLANKVEGVILGKALYAGTLRLPEVIMVLGERLFTKED